MYQKNCRRVRSRILVFHGFTSSAFRPFWTWRTAHSSCYPPFPPAFLYIVHIWWFLQLSWLKLINISNFYLNYIDEVEHLKPRIKAIENRLWVFTDNITEFSAKDTSLHFVTKLQKQWYYHMAFLKQLSFEEVKGLRTDEPLICREYPNRLPEGGQDSCSSAHSVQSMSTHVSSPK